MALRDGLVTHPSVRQRYQHLVETGALESDPAQIETAQALDRVLGDICDRRLARKSSALGWLFARRGKQRAPIKGLYLYGGVGRGKTMLMDLFFELVPVKRKRRAHFNDFMADVHDRIGAHRAALKNGETDAKDPMPPVAEALSREAWVLCFDEFSVTDIADAMILSRLFSALFERGVVLVATSNVAPDDLYRDGLNRGLFLPFIDILKRHVELRALEAETDYRLQKLTSIPVYMTPDDAAAARMMDDAWQAAVDGRSEDSETLSVKGRQLTVPRAVGNAARFTFAELCEKPLGARDYLALAERFDTLFVDHVPTMDDRQRNAAKRFILLIDTLYDSGARLFVSAAAEPDALYEGKTGAEAFEFERTASRLVEMQSRDWLARSQDGDAPAGRSEAAPAAGGG